MTRSEAIETIKENLPRAIWRKDKSRSKYPGYICPICNSGSGKNGTGISTKDGIHYTCWTGCFTNQDIISIIGLEYGINDFNAQFEKCCNLYGINYKELSADQNGTASPKIESRKAAELKPQEEAPQTDYTSFFKDARNHISESDYLTKRGISPELQKKMYIGYCGAWTNPKAPKAPASPRIIIPTSPNSYLARDTRPVDKYTKIKVGETHLFNSRALLESKEPVFVTEGEIDALSIMEAGLNAVGLGSVNMIDSLISFLRDNDIKTPILICLDNDKPGEAAKVKLQAKLNAIGVENYIVNPHEGYKDTNEALIADREAFITKCMEAKEAPSKEALETALKAQEAYLSEYSVLSNRKAFEAEIEGNMSLKTVSTGYCGLDELLNGGLYKGLYFIGGISSIGKTTFCMQIADNIAKAGNDVIIFALEMATNELIAKSISRNTYLFDMQLFQDTRHAKSTMAILHDKNKANYTEEEKACIEIAADAYFEEVAPHLFIYEGVGNIGVEAIREAVKRHILITGNKPVVFIDYLQILAPFDVKATDKQNTDKAVLELKRISRDEEIPIVAISSFNRESYTQAVTMASFKESGAVEYTSDVLIGLQFFGMDRIPGEADSKYTQRVKEERELQEEYGRTGKQQHLQVKVLKNRNGKKGSTDLYFLPAFNYVFEENPFTDRKQK